MNTVFYPKKGNLTMFMFNFYNGPYSQLIMTLGSPRYVYVNEYVTAFFLPPLTETDIEDEPIGED